MQRWMIDPHWKGSQGRGSYLIVPEEPSQNQYQYNPYSMPPMVHYPMGYYAPPYGGYPPGPPGPMPGYPGYPGMMSMGYPPGDYNYK